MYNCVVILMVSCRKAVNTGGDRWPSTMSRVFRHMFLPFFISPPHVKNKILLLQKNLVTLTFSSMGRRTQLADHLTCLFHRTLSWLCVCGSGMLHPMPRGPSLPCPGEVLIEKQKQTGLLLMAQVDVCVCLWYSSPNVWRTVLTLSR